MDEGRPLEADEVAARLAAGEPVEDADLTGLDLGVLLAGHRRPVLRRCTATEPDLHGADLPGLTLDACRFTDCRMIGADLSGLRGLAVTYRLDGSNLGLANLQDVAWRAVTLRGLDLSEADLRGADLRDATLLDCTLRDVDLAHTRLAGADLRGADLGELTDDAPRTLRGAIVSEAQAADVCRALGLVVS